MICFFRVAATQPPQEALGGGMYIPCFPTWSKSYVLVLSAAFLFIQCFCGDGSTDYDQYGEADCGMPCAGDENEVCGDRSVMSVYRYGFESPTPTPGSTYLGCYADVKSDRIMSKEASESNMTAEVRARCCHTCRFTASSILREGKWNVIAPSHELF